MSEEKIRLVIADDVAETRDNLAKLLYFEPDIVVVGSVSTGAEALEVCRQHNPHVILIDAHLGNQDGIEYARQIAGLSRKVGVIVMSVDGDQEHMRRAMRAGARDFLVKPFTSDELVQAIRRVYWEMLEAEEFEQKQLETRPVVEMGKGRIIAAYSPKGGVGRTTLLTNLAVAAAQSTGKRVALIDGSIYFGDVALMLNLVPSRSIGDVALEASRLDDDLLLDLMVSHSSGVRALLAPPKPQAAELVTPDLMKRVLEIASRHFDYVFVDTWQSLHEIVLTVLDMADTILLILKLELPLIRDGKQFLELADLLGYPRDKVLLVLNRSDSDTGIKIEVAEESLGRPFDAKVISDGRGVTMSVNQGVPLVLSHPNSRFSQDIARLLQVLLGEVQVANGRERGGLASRFGKLFRVPLKGGK
jgi:pilus assembly protein CpaE